MNKILFSLKFIEIHKLALISPIPIKHGEEAHKEEEKDEYRCYQRRIANFFTILLQTQSDESEILPF